MDSRFVPGGTLEKPTERDDEWLKAQQELDEKRRQREEGNSKQQDGRSLYEVLQANKAAKEEAFQESIKLKNQFRALNEEEADFLETTLEAERAKEEAVRRETEEQLERFRQQQEKAEPGEDNEGSLIPTEDDINWAATGKKRKRTKAKEGLNGIKARRTSSTNDGDKFTPSDDRKIPREGDAASSKAPNSSVTTLASSSTTAAEETTPAANTTNEDKAKTMPPKKPSLSLVSYDSDDESD